MKKRSFKWIIAVLAVVLACVMFGPKKDAYAEEAVVQVSTWTELKSAISNAEDSVPRTIRLTQDIKKEDGKREISVTSKKVITIDFNGHRLDGSEAFETDRQNTVGAFDNSGTLTLTSSGGYGSLYGFFGINGAVRNGSKLTVENIIFQNNSALAPGGVLFNMEGGTCNIISAEFTKSDSKLYDVAIYNQNTISIGDTDKEGVVYLDNDMFVQNTKTAKPIQINGPLYYNNAGGYYSSLINISPAQTGVFTSGYSTYNRENVNEFFRLVTEEDKTKYAIGMSEGEGKIIAVPTTTYNLTYKSNTETEEEVIKNYLFNSNLTHYVVLGDGVEFAAPEGKELSGWKFLNKVYKDHEGINLDQIYKNYIYPDRDTTIDAEISAEWKDLPKITVKATSVDGSLEIEDYVVSAKEGTSIIDALNSDEGIADHFEKDGYEFFGILPKEISQYDSRADLPSGDEMAALKVEEDTTVYAYMAKKISAVEMSVKAPVCGQEIKLEVEGDPHSQTNKPAVTFAEDAVYSIDNSKVGCIWLDPIGKHKDFTGTIKGGESYPAYADMISDLGYVFDGSVPSITGVEVVDDYIYINDSGETMYFEFEVLAVHEKGETIKDNILAPTCEEAGHHDEVVRCKGCDYVFEDTRVTGVEDAALGHDWGDWVVTKEASETEEGEEVRTCKHDESHKQTQTIPKKDPSNPDDKQDGDKKEDGKQDQQAGVKVGDTVVVAGSKYKILSADTVSFVQAKNAKTVTVPATVKSSGKTYKVTRIGANAFKKSKASKVIIKTKNLKKATVKNSLKGSKVKRLKIKVGKKKLNKTYLKKYKKIFTKKNAGKKIKITL